MEPLRARFLNVPLWPASSLDVEQSAWASAGWKASRGSRGQRRGERNVGVSCKPPAPHVCPVMGEASSHTKAWGLLGNCWVSALCPDLPSPECGNVLGSAGSSASGGLSLRQTRQPGPAMGESGLHLPTQGPLSLSPSPQILLWETVSAGDSSLSVPRSVSPRSASTGLGNGCWMCSSALGTHPAVAPASSREGHMSA